MDLLIIKSWHIIAMVAWFTGLFYLPRLFVYHSQSYDIISYERFAQMERKLYYYIMWPAAVITTILGLWLLGLGWQYYKFCVWMYVKLVLVGFLWCFHWFCGKYIKNFIMKRKIHSTKFYRWFNEFPTIILILIIMLVIIKPT